MHGFVTTFLFMKKIFLTTIIFLTFAITCLAGYVSDSTMATQEHRKWFVGANVGTGSSIGKYRVSWDMNFDVDFAAPVSKKSGLGLYASYRSWTTFVPGIFWTREKCSEGHSNLYGIGLILKLAHSHHYEDFNVYYNLGWGLEFKSGHSFPSGLYFLVSLGFTNWEADSNTPYYYYDANRGVMNVYNTEIYHCSFNIHAGIGYRFSNNKKK